MKNILMIAYAFPPMIASGAARPAKFAKYLAEIGYFPTVITRVPPRGECQDEEALWELDGRCQIIPIRVGDDDDWHLWMQRRLALPDRIAGAIFQKPNALSDQMEWGYRRIWPGLRENVHWIWPAVIAGLRVIWREKINLIWATGDPWSSLVVGYWLSRLTGKPLIADIRDPWTYGVLWHPFDEAEASRAKRWERRVINRAVRTVYTSPKTAEIMRGRLPGRLSKRICTITNGFDDIGGRGERAVSPEKCCFCYVGKLTRNYRKPDLLLEAFRIARKDPELRADVRLHFVGDMGGYASELKAYGVDDGVLCSGVVSYQTSISYMRGADVLVLLQTISGPGKDVISGKLYEYLAVQRPVLAITAKDGGDAWLVRSTGAGHVTGLDDPENVAASIRDYWLQWKQGSLKSDVAPDRLEQFRRRQLTEELGELFDEVLSGAAPRAGNK